MLCEHGRWVARMLGFMDAALMDTALMNTEPIDALHIDSVALDAFFIHFFCFLMRGLLYHVRLVNFGSAPKRRAPCSAPLI